MESNFMKCKNYTKDIDLRFSGTKNGKAMILSKCAICGSKKSKFIKNQETLGDPLQKTKKEFKNLKTQEIQTIFTK